MKEKTLAELAEYVGGKVKGNPNVKIRSAATLEQASEGDISFLNNPRYENQLKTTKAGAVIVNKEIQTSTSLLITDEPYFAFREVVVLLYGHRLHKRTGISKKASISESAVIGKNCDIADFVTISDKVRVADGCVIYPGVCIGPETEIGNDCILYPNVVIYDKCRIGNKVTIHANTTVGEDGFGFATYKGEHQKIPHIGSVIIEDDVEIGSGCGVERGTLDNTIIGKGTKVGDLVTVGHGTKIGPHCLLVAQVGIAGSARVGRHCVVGGQVGIVGHINIGNEVMIAAQAGVINDVPDGKTIIGAPAIDANKARRAYALIESLPQMRQSIKKLEKQIKKLEKE